MSYIKEIGFRQTLTGKQILQVLVQTKDKDFDTIRRWKDADVHDLLEAVHRGFINWDSPDTEEKPDKDIEPPKFDIVSEGGSRKP